MKTRYFYRIGLCSLLIGATESMAQGGYTFDQLTVERQKQVWTTTRNAAGLAISPLENNGQAAVEFRRKTGAYHRPQEGEALSRYAFATDKYTNLKDRVYLWGSFGFESTREYDRAWSDGINPYNGNPYQYGSGRLGDYTAQRFDLEAKLATQAYGRFHFGVGGMYHVGDQSRLNDPRPRVLYANYGVIPSVTIQVAPRHQVGLDLYYRFNKERLVGITTVQDSKLFIYYDMLGLENAQVAAIGSFQRNCRAYYWGGDLQYGYEGVGFRWLTSVGYEIRLEDIYDQNRAEPGNFKSTRYSMQHSARWWNARSLHTADLQGTYDDGNADRYRQERKQSTDEYGNVSQWWETVYKALYYRNYRTEISANYRRYALRRAGYSWFWGVGAYYQGLDERYLLPVSSRELNRMALSVEVGGFLWRGSRDAALHIDVDAVYNFPVKRSLSVASESEIYHNVLLPDMAFFKLHSVGANLQVRYDFPLRGKKSTTMGFFKFFGGGLTSTDKHTIIGERQKLWNFGASLGVTLR